MTFRGEGEDKYLVFQLAKRQFALEMNSIRRVVNADQIYGVPLAKKYYAGLMRFEGRAIPLFNLRAALGLKGKVKEEESLVAVEQMGDYEVGLLIGSVYSVADLGEGTETDRDPEMVGVNKVVELDGKEINVVDLGELLRDSGLEN